MELTPVNEQSRTYIFPDGSELEIREVVGFACPGSTHRLRVRNGDLYIVAPGWIAIAITGAKEFTL